MSGSNNSPRPQRPFLMLWLLLSVALVVVLLIGFLDDASFGGISLRQGTFKDVILAPPSDSDELPADSGALAADSVAPGSPEAAPVLAETDTTVKSVLIFGDSMTILVANRMAAYGEKNGYKVTSVTWDSSSSVGWSGCDTLDNFIARVHPDFIMVTLGSNELFLKNFNARKPFVEKLVSKMQGIPFVWIGPPNWKEDKGYNAMMESTLPPGTFFRTEGLELPRSKDNVHPTPRGGVIWTDSIMRWMKFTPHPIPAEVPDSGVTTRSHRSFYYKAG